MDSEIRQEVEVLKNLGFDHVLLVTGEANHTVNINYFLNAIDVIKNDFSTISVEVQPLSQEEYERLHEAGVHSVLVYQETYHQEVYKNTIPKERNLILIIDTPDRIGKAGIHKIGLAALLGLEDYAPFFLTPRLRPAEGTVAPNFIMDDTDLTQLTPIVCGMKI
jgi:2-iminoacetate synthase